MNRMIHAQCQPFCWRSGRRLASLWRPHVPTWHPPKPPHTLPYAYVAANKWRKAGGEGDIQIWVYGYGWKHFCPWEFRSLCSWGDPSRSIGTGHTLVATPAFNSTSPCCRRPAAQYIHHARIFTSSQHPALRELSTTRAKRYRIAPFECRSAHSRSVRVEWEVFHLSSHRNA